MDKEFKDLEEAAENLINKWNNQVNAQTEAIKLTAEGFDIVRESIRNIYFLIGSLFIFLLFKEQIFSSVEYFKDFYFSLPESWQTTFLAPLFRLSLRF